MTTLKTKLTKTGKQDEEGKGSKKQVPQTIRSQATRTVRDDNVKALVEVEIAAVDFAGAGGCLVDAEEDWLDTLRWARHL
jgi:hypothetical protein